MYTQYSNIIISVYAIYYYNNIRLVKRRVSSMVVSRVRAVDGWGDRYVVSIIVFAFRHAISPRLRINRAHDRFVTPPSHARLLLPRAIYTRACPLGSSNTRCTYILPVFLLYLVYDNNNMVISGNGGQVAKSKKKKKEKSAGTYLYNISIWRKKM